MHSVAAWKDGESGRAFGPGPDSSAGSVPCGRPALPGRIRRRAGRPPRIRLRGAMFLNGIRTDGDGATIIEYSLLMGLVALAAVTTFHSFGDAVGGMFGVIASVYSAALK